MAPATPRVSPSFAGNTGTGGEARGNPSMLPLGNTLDFPSKQVSLDETRHGAIFGATGSGKSTLLSFLAIQAIRSGFPLFVIDPHGTLVNGILPYVPKSRLRDVIIFDPLDPKKQLGLNPLKHGDEVAALSFIEILAGLGGENSFMARSRDIATNFLLAAIHTLPDPCPFDLALMFSFDEYAKDIFHRCPVDWLRIWGENHFGRPDKQRQDAEAAPSNKANALVTLTSLRHIFAQTDGLDFFDAMQSGKLVFFNLQKGHIGEEAANLLGSVVLRMILTAALKRDPEKKNKQCLVIVDEFHNFTKGGTGPDQILSETRKYNISFFLADQTAETLPRTALASIFTNSSTLVLFRVSASDAEQLAKEVRANPETLNELPTGRFYAKVVTPNLVATNLHLETLKFYKPADKKKRYPRFLPILKGDEPGLTACYRYSRENYGTLREKVEASINAAIANATKGANHVRSPRTRSSTRKATGRRKAEGNGKPLEEAG